MKLILFAALAAVLLLVARRMLASPPTPSRDTPAPPSSEMSEKTACDLFGLPPDPSRDEVIAAHKRLMQKVHPDRGGSTALAQQLNEAKRILLKRR